MVRALDSRLYGRGFDPHTFAWFVFEAYAFYFTLICLSIFSCRDVRDVDHTYFHFGLFDRMFVLCLFPECPDMTLLGYVIQ